jgi:hypothetical protein
MYEQTLMNLASKEQMNIFAIGDGKIYLSAELPLHETLYYGLYVEKSTSADIRVNHPSLRALMYSIRPIQLVQEV